jgi:hypothetical protein
MTRAAVCLASLLVTTTAFAQQPARVTLSPENPARWDAAGYAGWLAVNKADVAPDWDEWYDAASFGVSLGRSFTPHLKIELDVATTTEAEVFVQEPITIPAQPLPIVRVGQYEFRTTSVGGGVLYQFFENAWFHPFIGVGVEAIREVSRLSVQEQPLCVRAPCPPGPFPDVRDVDTVARPFAAGGFKWYVSERAFIRSDLRTTLSRDGAEAVLWRIGIGADF